MWLLSGVLNKQKPDSFKQGSAPAGLFRLPRFTWRTWSPTPPPPAGAVVRSARRSWWGERPREPRQAPPSCYSYLQDRDHRMQNQHKTNTKPALFWHLPGGTLSEIAQKNAKPTLFWHSPPGGGRLILLLLLLLLLLLHS
jgi:hypothetical protein